MFCVLLFSTCRPQEEGFPTAICVRTMHHDVRVPRCTVYVKYNYGEFLGYQQPPSYYDDVFYTGADARGCLHNVPEGTHLLVAFGYDSVYYPHHVFGSLDVHIRLADHPVADTTFYVSE